MKEKTFTLDWDNYDEVSALGNKIKCRLGELNEKRLSKKERNKFIMECCRSIYDADISAVYTGEYDIEKKYYVYAHLDTTRKIAIGRHGITTFAATLGMTHFPFYIGKGTGDRYLDFNRNETHRKVRQKIESLDKKPIALIVKDELNEKESLMLEAKLIDIFGLMAHTTRGMLVNLDEGLNRDERRVYYRDSFNKLRDINRIL